MELAGQVVEELLHTVEEAFRTRAVVFPGRTAEALLQLFQQLLLLLIQPYRRLHHHAAQQIALGAAANGFHTFAAHAEQLAGLGFPRHFQVHATVQRRHFDFTTECRHREVDRHFAVQQACPHCHGRGTLIKDPCTKCHGHGRVEKTKTLSVKIPAGVDTGDRIRLAGEGEAGEHGAPAGDLYVQVQVKQHAIFEREGNNLYCEVPINFAMAALGGEIEVPTLDGRVNLKIPGETQTGKLFRMRGKGVKSVRGGAQGDLLCRVVVETPVGLNDKQKQLLKELQESFGGPTGEKNSPRSKSFFDGVKKFFDDLTR